MGLTDYVAGSPLGQAAQQGSSAVSNTISSVQNYVNGVSNKFILNPHGMKGIAGFVFDYEGDDQISLEADITDHFSEDNGSIQDHIALKPYRVTLRGFVSELILPATSQGFFGALTTLQSKMGTVNAYLGKYTPQALQKLQGQASKAVSQVQNYANTAAQYLNQAKNVAGLFGGGTGAPTKQQQAFVALASLRDQRQIFNVLTPWSLMPGMAIETLVFLQAKDSKSRSDITVTMKQMRFVDVQSSQNTTATHLGRAGFAYQLRTQLGLTSGTPTLLGNTRLATPGAF